jgi:hypothetical protein
MEFPEKYATPLMPHPGIGEGAVDSELVRLMKCEMQCPICTELWLEPHIVCSNQHNICKDCLANLLRKGQKRECPECRATITSVKPNRFACKAVQIVASATLGAGLLEERSVRHEAAKPLDLDCLLASIPKPPYASDSEDDSELGWGTSDSEEELESTSSASQSWMRTPRASLAPSLRTILVNDTLAPTGDQQGLDRTLDVQRRRDQEIERRQREDSQEHGSDGSRWARENWGQRAAGLESLDRIVGVQQQRRHDPEIERQQREDSPERNEPRQWARERRGQRAGGLESSIPQRASFLTSSRDSFDTEECPRQARALHGEHGPCLRAILVNDTLAPTGDQQGLDRTLDVQRRRDQEIERRQREDSQEHGGDATGRRWARENWGQRAAGLESNVAEASVQERASSATGSRGPFKTKLCRFFSTPNGCQRGDACSFAHGDAQLRPYRR